MTTTEDERPATPEDRRPTGTAAGALADQPHQSDQPHPADRARRWTRGAVRTLQRLAGAAVLAGTLLTAFTPWGSETWYAGWVGAGFAAAVMAVTAAVRPFLREGGGSGRIAGPLLTHALMALLLAVFCGLFAFGLSGWLHEHDRDRRATLRVPATVTDCTSGPDSGFDCRYHWSVDGRDYSTREGASDQWPDGHRVNVRIDPVHPQRSPVTDGAYGMLWIAVVMGAVGGPLACVLWWVVEGAMDD